MRFYSSLEKKKKQTDARAVKHVKRWNAMPEWCFLVGFILSFYYRHEVKFLIIEFNQELTEIVFTLYYTEVANHFYY